MPRKRSMPHTGGGGGPEEGVLSYAGTKPGDIRDILRDRGLGQYRAEAKGDPLNRGLLANKLQGERFVLTDKYSTNGNRFITLWFEGEYQNSKVFDLLRSMSKQEGFPHYKVERPCEYHPDYTTINIGCRTKAALMSLLDDGKLQFEQGVRRSGVPDCFERLERAEPKDFRGRLAESVSGNAHVR